MTIWEFAAGVADKGDWYGSVSSRGVWVKAPTIVVSAPDAMTEVQMMFGVDDFMDFVEHIHADINVLVAKEQSPAGTYVDGTIILSMLASESPGDGHLGWTTVNRADPSSTASPFVILSARSRVASKGPMVRATVRHELLHAFGVGGHDPYAFSLMNENVRDAQYSGRDLRTLDKLYVKMP